MTEPNTELPTLAQEINAYLVEGWSGPRDKELLAKAAEALSGAEMQGLSHALLLRGFRGYADQVDAMARKIREQEAELASRQAPLREAREEVRGINHPGWPDPIGFNWGSSPHANAAGWLEQHRAQHPDIAVQRRFVTDWVTFDPTVSNAAGGADSGS